MIDEKMFEARVRAIVQRERALPALVSQRTVERWTGLPARDYLATARANAFTISKVKRLVLARTEDVIRWIDSHRVQNSTVDNDEWGTALARAGARRVGTR